MNSGRHVWAILLAVHPGIASAMLLGLLVAPSGCYQAISVREDPGERPRAFTEAEEAYLRHDTGRALHIYERYRRDNPGSEHEALALYFEGQCLLLEGGPIRARQRLEMARAALETPRSPPSMGSGAVENLAGPIAMAIGNCFFIQDRYEEAEESYLSARGSGGVPADEVLYKSALCARRLGRWEEADRRLREVVDHFPGGHRARAARLHLAWTDRHFAIQAGMFRVKQNAESRAAEIRKTGLEPTVQTIGATDGMGPAGAVGARGETLFRVSVGRYRDYAAAKREMAALRQKGVLTDALIIP